MIAALFVAAGGCYSLLDGVDAWPEERDARLYAGPWPVVAHPPCARWSQLAGLVEARYPHLKRGEDGWCFASALASVRRWGGVLEHPAYSKAWEAFDLPRPLERGWVQGFCGGWSCHVEQVRYGHRARKATWLYWIGPGVPPPMRWGTDGDALATAVVSWCKNHGGRAAAGERRHVTKRERNATPADFRDALMALAKAAAR